MIKQGIVRAALMLLIVFAVALPTFAQDATEAAPSADTPSVCTPDELKQVIAQVGKISEKMTDASKAGTDAQTTDQLTASLLAWGDAYQTYFSGVYTGYPQCIDGVLMSDMLGFLLNEQMTLSSAALLGAVQPDMGNDKTLIDMATAQNSMETQGSGAFSTFIKLVGQGNATGSWLPACTADQLKLTTTLDGFEQTWVEQAPAMQTYLNDGTVDKTAYLALAKLVGDFDAILPSDSWDCTDLYRRVINDIYIFGDSFTALSIGAIAPSIKDNADFTHLQQYFDSVISDYLTTLIATPEATDTSS